MGSSHSVFPLIGYSSDYGLFGGVVYQRINYADRRRPYLSNTLIDVVGSTNGKWAGQFDYERIEMFGLSIRNRSVLEFELNPNRSFFGIGNNTSFSGDAFEDGKYFLNQNHLLISFQVRKPVINLSEKQSLEGVLRLKGSYTSVSDRGSETIFSLRRPEDTKNGSVNTAGIGLIYDSRVNEFDPRFGQQAEMGIDASSPILGSNFLFYEAFADYKAYIPITGNLVFAQRVAAKYNTGDTPFWELPTLGSDKGLRGFALDRFMGDSSVLSMSEVRSWLFSFLEGEVKIGAHAFYDTGRVFSNKDSDQFFGQWKNTWGVGGAMTLFNPDLIFRGEVGFSGEDYRIYAGLGYAF